MLSHYSLEFLESLGDNPCEEDIQQVWADRVFPLVRTGDFAKNWSVVDDSDGIFARPNGTQCRVEPQSHHHSRCCVLIQHDNQTYSEECMPYEAIVFAKITHALSLKELKVKNTACRSEVARQYFIQRFVNKLPSRWRQFIVQAEAHKYDESGTIKPEIIGQNVYKRLSNPMNIRLLSVLPSLESYNPIQCSLREIDLALHSEYEALSYAWGRSDARSVITVNDQSFAVTPDLEAALRDMRRREQERVMWVDAICIDQSNLQERAQQVMQMDRVYLNATRVVVWLGRESVTSSRIFRSLHLVSKEREKHDFESTPPSLNFPFHPEPFNWDTDKHVVTEIPIKPVLNISRPGAALPQELGILKVEWLQHLLNLTEAYRKILRRRWWKRVWVLQEVIHARRIILQCGSQAVEWPLFQEALYSMIQSLKESGFHYNSGITRRAQAHLELCWAASATFPFFLLHRASQETGGRVSLSMSRLLALTTNFDASDPRDQIFGLITLLDEASDERNDFRPNYMLPTRWLYIQVAQRFLVQSQKLEIITAHAAPPDYQMHKVRRWKQDLPSWVPDWTIHSLWQLNSIWISSFSPYNALFPFMHHSRDSEDVIRPASSRTTTSPSTEQAGQVYNASLHEISPFPLEFSTDGGILRVCGVPFDTVEVVGTSWDIGRTMSQSFDTTMGVLNLEHNNKIQLSIVNQWKEIARLDDPGTYPFSPHSRREAFWRTFLLDRVRSMREPLYIRRIPSEPTEETLSEAIWGPGVDCGFPPESQSDEDFLIFYVRKEGAEWWAFGNINLHCVNLVFFRTTKGCIGVGHPNIQPGDQIAVLLGAPVPIVLRQYEEGHIVIGQSYVHGIMDGEVIEMERECGRGRKKEDFQVYDLI